MDKSFLDEWLKLPDNTKKNIFNEVSTKTGLPAAAVEKDWWVVRTLDVVFNTEVGAHTVFKGGTSLSKAWGLIDRFSEDIDLALDKKFLGFDKEMTKSQVKKLRKHSFQYISEEYFPLIEKAYKEYGLLDVNLKLTEPTSDDQDPLIIEVHYPGLTEKADYIQPRVLIEIGSRSLREPFTVKEFSSMVGEQFNGQPFADKPVSIPTVNPERTFLEKIFLLHEEFQQSEDKIRVDRLSRHLYDIGKIMDTEYAKKALEDKELYQHIVEHRKTITPLRGINYANHTPDKLNPLPPVNLLSAWRKDYEQMQQNMIFGESLSFDDLIFRIVELKNLINKIKF